MMTSSMTIDNGRVTITPAHDGSVWMSKHQIANLFGCFVAKVVSNISSILKSGILDENRVCRLHRYKDGGCLEIYNLEMIIALAFRIHSQNADIFRRRLRYREGEHDTHPTRSIRNADCTYYTDYTTGSRTKRESPPLTA